MHNIAHAPVNTTLAVTDLERARKFYGHTLGLKEVKIPMNTPGEEGVTFEAGQNTHLYLYKRAQPSGSTATACSFSVDDVEGCVKDLQGKGIKFEEYDMPDIKTQRGIATLGDLKTAWFKDPDGNILAVENMIVPTSKRAQEIGQTH